MRVVELFAGVGGFRIGFESKNSDAKEGDFRVIWANQWEPSTKVQHAAQVYARNWNLTPTDDPEIFTNDDGDYFVNKDISTIDAKKIPDHDIICGGFPCQDYSVASN